MLTNKWDILYHPNTYIDYPEFLRAIQVRVEKGESSNEIISRIYVYKLADNEIVDISLSMREDLKNKLTKK